MPSAADSRLCTQTPPPLIQKLTCGHLARHRHRTGYVTIVLDGRYAESGDSGRKMLSPADAVVHGPFEAHQDMIQARGATVLNLEACKLQPGFYRVLDLAAIAAHALAGRTCEALHCFAAMAQMQPASYADWPDLLAAEICASPSLLIKDWAQRHALRPAAVSAGFAAAFGVTAKRFRAESKARIAWKLIYTTNTPLASIAADVDFVDQAHMSRAVFELTGLTPGSVRRSKPSEIDRELTNAAPRASAPGR